MAGRADFLVDLIAALELRPVEGAERPFEAERRLLGGELLLGGKGRRRNSDEPEQSQCSERGSGGS